MKNNKVKERAYYQFKNKLKVALITIPIMVIFAIVIMIIMACNGITDRKTYLKLVIAIVIGIIGFLGSLHAVKKCKREDENQE